jgi:hypothetical protein
MNEIQPLRDIRDQARLRDYAEQVLAMSATLRTQIELDLADGVLRALAQIELLTGLADRQAARFGTAAGHKYPDLVAAGLGHLWQGPGFNDWDPSLLEGIRKHLKQMDRPCHKGACCDYIRNRLHEGAAGLGALELRFEEGQPTPNPSREGSNTLTPNPSPKGRGGADLPKTLGEMSPEERAEALAAIHRGRPTRG